MSSKHWRKKQGKDRYFRQARQDGYRARSAYKLKEINNKFRILRKADQVLDIGAAPGSWSQFARQVVGQRGKVIAVDLKEIEPIAGVEIIQGDVRDAAVLQQIQTLAGEKPFNTVISDIAPNTSGIRHMDHARSIELSLFALTIAIAHVRPGGNFVTKVFMGGEFDLLLKLTRRYFRRVNVFNPDAKRRESKETFIVAKGLKATAQLDPEMGLSYLLTVEPQSFGKESRPHPQPLGSARRRLNNNGRGECFRPFQALLPLSHTKERGRGVRAVWGINPNFEELFM